jgi:iron complex outermembrane receptor protein
VIATRHELGGGTLNVDFPRHNYKRPGVEDVKPGTINGGREYDLENQVPKNRSTLTFDYAKGAFDGLSASNRYGGWRTTPGLFSGVGDGSDAVGLRQQDAGGRRGALAVQRQVHPSPSAATTCSTCTPDKEKDGTLQFLGQE